MKIDEELSKFTEEKLKTQIFVDDNKKVLEQLEATLEQQRQDSEHDGSGDEELTQLLIMALASPNQRAKQLAASLQKRMDARSEAFLVEESAEEMDADVDPYLAEGGDASWDAPQPGAQSSQPTAASEASGSKAAATAKAAATPTRNSVRQTIEKINSKKDSQRPFSGARKSAAVFTVPGKEEEDF